MLTTEHEIVLAVDTGCSFNQFRVLMREVCRKANKFCFVISESTLHILI
jgi:hypothetical protein